MTKLIVAAALAMLFPVVAQAKGPDGWTTMGKNDKHIRSLIAKELNTRHIGITGSAHYTMTSIKGERKALGGNPMYGSQSSVKFTAQPRVKITVGNKKQWVSIGGVAGECKFGSVMCRPPAISSFKVTSLLRGMMP